MVALSHGRPVATTSGWLSEPFWTECGAVVLTPADDPAAMASAVSRLLSDRPRLADLSARAAALYRERFDLRHTIRLLRDAPWRRETAGAGDPAGVTVHDTDAKAHTGLSN